MHVVISTPGGRTRRLRCSVGTPSYDQSCPAAVRRADNGLVSLTIRQPDGDERRLRFEGDKVTVNSGKVEAELRGDEWAIGIDGRFFCSVPEAMLYGG